MLHRPGARTAILIEIDFLGLTNLSWYEVKKIMLLIPSNIKIICICIDQMTERKKRLFILTLLTSLLVGFSGYGVAGEDAQSKISVGREDFMLWHELSMPSEEARVQPSKNISKNGEWIAYQIKYVSNPERKEIRIRGVVNGDEHLIPTTQPGYFLSDGERYIYTDLNGWISVIHLRTGESTHILPAKSFDFIDDADVVVTFSPQVNAQFPSEGTLSVINILTGETHQVGGVSSYRIHSESHKVAYVVRRNGVNTVEIIHARSPSLSKVVSAGFESRFSSLTWDKTGTALAFICSDEDDRVRSIELYSADSHGLPVYKMHPAKFSTDYEGLRISDRRLLISDDRKFVLFDVEPIQSRVVYDADGSISPPLVQVWNARDRFLPILRNRAPVSYRTLAWWPERRKLVTLGNEGQRFATLTGDQRFAVLLSANKAKLPDGHELDYPGLAADVHLVDILSGNRKLILERQGVDRGKLSVSPGGRYLAYFRDGDWWTYDIDSEAHVNVSAQTKRAVVASWFGSEVSPWRGTPYGGIGWIGSDIKLVFSDKYDIWQASPDGQNVARITNGREREVAYRVYVPLHGPLRDENARYPGGSPPHGYQGAVIDPDDGVIVSMFGERTKQSGYSIWTSKAGVSKISYDDVHVDFIQPVSGGGQYIFRRQRFDLPPELVLHDMTSEKPTVLVKSNPQHFSFKWGRSELVEYATTTGTSLQGVLYYPANYQEGKKYPMIVDVYETQSNQLHRYISPSETAYNYATNFTLEGYFVLRPDIVYELNNPGISATECTVSAVHKVLSMGMIDQNRIGLMGHSFGGYETAFIVTQTNLFSAAVAGAPFTDTVSMYLSMWADMPALWRFEQQQFRMMSPFHEDQKSYTRNSPIHNASKIETPLLTWTGEDDTIVPSSQSFGLFSLLRRMQKEHILLVYSGEHHHPMNSKKSGPDLYGRIKAWFDHYLKGKPPEDWILGEAGSSASAIAP